MSSSKPTDIHDRAADLVMQLGQLLESASLIEPLVSGADRLALADACHELERHALAVAEHARVLPVSFPELICGLGDESLQTLLWQAPAGLLALALRGEDETLRDRVLDNLSANAALGLRDEIDTMSPQRRSDIRAAQQQIILGAVELARRGDITLTVQEARHG